MACAAFAMLFLSFAGLVHINEAQALRVSMKRVIFEGSKRSDVLTLLNNTPKEQTYRLGWKHYMMTEDRSLVSIDDDEEAMKKVKWADDMVRFAPRRVVVAPGASQQVRLLLRRPRDLPAGEYRSHLWIITEGDAKSFAGEAREQGSGVKLAMLPALTLPVFVRNGDLEATASIENTKMVRTADGATVSFVLKRGGNRSLYGDLNVVCLGGDGNFVASARRGIAVYTETDKRNFEYDISYPAEQADACRSVRIEYVADKDDAQYGGKVMAQGQAAL